MSNKHKYLYFIGIVAAFGIGLIVGIIVNWPEADEMYLAGTVGKAKKYRNVQMTEKDIELRSELTRDSAQLKQMIQGMITFSVATDEVSKSIDMTLSTFRFKGMGSLDTEKNQIRILEDYSNYIRNNNSKLNSTIDMLTAFYLKDSANQSQDVERNLREFGMYIKGLVEKNKQLGDAVAAMDSFMLNNPALASHQEGLRELKAIRDRLLMKGLQVAAIIGSQEQIAVLVGSALYNEEKIGVILGQEKLSVIILANEKLGIFTNLSGHILATDQLKVDYGAVGSLSLNKESTIMLYDQSKLQFIAVNETGIKAIAKELNYVESSVSSIGVTVAAITAASGLQVILATGKDNLSVAASNYSLQDLIGSGIAGSLTAQNLNVIYSMGSVGAIGAIGNFGIIILALNSQGMGFIL